MKLAPGTKRSIVKAAKIVLIVEVVYLVLINTALQLPLTQTLINQIRPEKFHVSWERAWSWYPFRVHVRGVAGNGQSRSQQWQFSASSVSGSISLLPLAFKRVWVSGVDVTDVDYLQRPRLKADRDFTQIMPYFPPIEGREINQADTSPRKEKRPWYVSIDDIRLDGSHSLWIYQLKGRLNGGLEADLEVRSRGGPLTLDGRNLDLFLETFSVSGGHEVFRRGRVSGTMGFDTFVPRENRGAEMLKFLKLDVGIDVDVNSLAFINLFMLNFGGVEVDGSGEVTGRLQFAKGEVLEGTDLAVNARDIRLKAVALNVEGDGDINLVRGDSTGGLMDLGFEFRDLQVTHSGDSDPLLVGEGLDFAIGGDGRVLPTPGKINESRTLSISIDGLAVPDLSLLQRYLPEKWPFRLYGGDGNLQGHARLSPTSLDVDLRLDSDEADMGIRQYRFDTDLNAVLRLENPSVMDSHTRVAGTFVELSDATLQKEGEDEADPWSASVRIKEGKLAILPREEKREKEHAMDLFLLLGDKEARQMLGDSRGLMNFEASVSSLAWLGVLFGNDSRTQFGGSGTIGGDVRLHGGLPDAGTHVEVASHELAVNFLDYVSTGEGTITLKVEEGGGNPDWRMTVALRDGDMRRRGETEAGIRDVDLALEALVEDVSFQKRENPFTIEFDILSARVTDMSVFNGYLPPDTPLQLTRGTADLTADIVLQRDDADGWLKLDSSGVEALLDGQSIGGDLTADILLVGGVPADMMFDISGSVLSLANVRVMGESQEFDQAEWSAELELVRGETTWNDPLRLDAEAEFSISDSRPFVALFKNNGGPAWLGNMLTVEDIAGDADLLIENEHLIVPFAHATSDNIDVGLKGVISEQSRDGVFFLRYKKLNALLKVTGGKRNLDIIKARQKYDQYQVDYPGLPQK
jgi:hypothetical protein